MWRVSCVRFGVLRLAVLRVGLVGRPRAKFECARRATLIHPTFLRFSCAGYAGCAS